MTRPLPPPRPRGVALRGSSSEMLFQAPQASHRPAQRGRAAPQSLQTKRFSARAIGSLTRPAVSAARAAQPAAAWATAS